MFRSTISIMMILLLAVVFAPADLLAGGDDGPEICTDCSLPPYNFNCAVIADEISDAFPGHTVEVSIWLSTDVVIDEIEIWLDIHTSLNVLDFNYESSAYSGNINPNFNTYLEIQFTGGQVGPGNDLYLGEIELFIDTDVLFDTPMYINHVYPFPRVSKTDDPNRCEAIPDNGSVRTIDGQYSFKFGDPVGYSYQAQDTGDPAKNILIEVPFYFKSNYPVGRFQTGITWPEPINTDNDFVGFFPEPGIDPQVLGTWPDMYIVDQVCDYQPSETFVLLGNLKFNGHDYGTGYESLTFSPVDDITFHDYPTEVECENSSTLRYWNQDWHDNGSINYPEYKCRTTFLDVYMDPRNSDLTMPAKVNHTFWSQGFTYYIEIDSLAARTLDNATVTSDDPPVQQVLLTPYADMTTRYKVYEVKTHNPSDPGHTYYQKGRYILPNPNEEIFKMWFTPTDSFSTCVGCQTTINIDNFYTSKNSDFFHLNSAKIERFSTQTGYFNINTGIISTPKLRLDARDNVPCEKTGPGSYGATVPVRVAEVVDNYYTRVRLYSTCRGGMRFDGISNGDFLINWGEPLITERGTKLEIEGTMASGLIDRTNTLIKLEFYSEDLRLTTDVIIDSILFSDVETAPGQGPFYAVFTEDGSIQDCNSPGPKQDPCGDCPIPYTYFLSQAYPNPFNANTIIEFGLAEPGHVSLDIYDILGKKVRTLKSEEMEPGAHQATWDGANDAGAMVGSGFYFYIIQTSEFTDRKRMTLLK